MATEESETGALRIARAIQQHRAQRDGAPWQERGAAKKAQSHIEAGINAAKVWRANAKGQGLFDWREK